MIGSYATLAPVTLSGTEIAGLTGGRLERASKRPVHGAAVDSRRVQLDNLFVALPGERTDGHEYLVDAARAGASALLVSRPGALPDAIGDVSVIRVDRPLDALQALAAAWRMRFDPITVGITGSIAKTSTKEAVAAVLATRFTTLRNEGNENNEIGLPLTVLRLGPEHEALVLEMGMYVEGEIAELVRIGRPDIGVVTAVQPVHLARIGTIDAIEREKGRLVEGLPAEGTAVLNVDDPRVRTMAARTVARTIGYGFSESAEVRAQDLASRGLSGMRFTLVAPIGRQAIELPQLGRHSVENALAAAAVGLAVGLELNEIATGLASVPTAAHRGQLFRLGDVTIIDDAYNAAPATMRAALDLLADLPGRRIAVLGEMLELGDVQEAGHREVGRHAAGIVDLLIVVGLDAGAIADGAIEAGLSPARVLRAGDPEQAHELLAPRLTAGDVVLVKASRGIALDRLVDALRADARP